MINVQNLWRYHMKSMFLQTQEGMSSRPRKCHFLVVVVQQQETEPQEILMTPQFGNIVRFLPAINDQRNIRLTLLNPS